MDGDAGGTAQEREDECSVHVSGVCAHCTTASTATQKTIVGYTKNKSIDRRMDRNGIPSLADF